MALASMTFCPYKLNDGETFQSIPSCFIVDYILTEKWVKEEPRDLKAIIITDTIGTRKIIAWLDRSIPSSSRLIASPSDKLIYLNCFRYYCGENMTKTNQGISLRPACITEKQEEEIIEYINKNRQEIEDIVLL